MGKVITRKIPNSWKISYIWHRTFEYLLPQFEIIEEKRNRDRYLPLPPVFNAKEQAETMTNRLIKRVLREGRLNNCYLACLKNTISKGIQNGKNIRNYRSVL